MINKTTLTFLLIILIFACSNIKKQGLKFNDETSDTSKVLDNQNTKSSIYGKVFIVKDSSKYSPNFIKDLKELYPEYESLLLTEEKIIMDSRVFNGRKYINTIDTIHIPSELPLNTLVNYIAEKNNKKYMLSLKRTNYTNVEYELLINKNLIKSGQVILPGGFILGMELTEDGEGNAFGIIQYVEKNNCSTFIGIEIDSGERASFRMYCEKDSTKNIDDIPPLIRE